MNPYLRLARVGFENVSGYLNGGIDYLDRMKN